MNEFDFIENLKVLEIKEDDALVVKIGQRISLEKSERLKRTILDNLPERVKGKVKVFILEEGMDIEILRLNVTE